MTEQYWAYCSASWWDGGELWVRDQNVWMVPVANVNRQQLSISGRLGMWIPHFLSANKYRCFTWTSDSFLHPPMYTPKLSAALALCLLLTVAIARPVRPPLL